MLQSPSRLVIPTLVLVVGGLAQPVEVSANGLAKSLTYETHRIVLDPSRNGFPSTRLELRLWRSLAADSSGLRESLRLQILKRRGSGPTMAPLPSPTTRLPGVP